MSRKVNGGAKAKQPTLVNRDVLRFVFPAGQLLADEAQLTDVRRPHVERCTELGLVMVGTEGLRLTALGLACLGREPFPDTGARCNVCLVVIAGAGSWTRCTNRRCAPCHALWCTDGGSIFPGHGLGEPPRWDAAAGKIIAGTNGWAVKA